MASTIRDFTNFKGFSGKINPNTGYYEFPKLFVISSLGQRREWKIFIRLIKKASQSSKTNKYNWNLMDENEVKIKPEYLEDDSVLPKGIISQFWTESGITGGKISRSPATYPKETNLDKANHRNFFHQALVAARSKFIKKSEAGSETQVSRNSKDDRFFPMLAKNYKNFVKKVNYPIYVQPKLDGIRCIIFLRLPRNKRVDDTTIENVIMYSRQKKEFPLSPVNNLIRMELLNLLKKTYDTERKQSIYLDGELYNHKLTLQEITSKTRKSDASTSSENSLQIQHHCYDMFYPWYGQDQSFDFRTKELTRIFTLFNDVQKYTQLVRTKLCTTSEKQDDMYRNFISKNYEGIMIRNPKGHYAKDNMVRSSKLRSRDLLKRKEVFTEEFEVIDFTQGSEGKDKGAIIWIAQTDAGNHFNVVPVGKWGSYTNRYKLFKEVSQDQCFRDKYANRMLMVEFRGWSLDRVPQHAKAVGFRDYM